MNKQIAIVTAATLTVLPWAILLADSISHGLIVAQRDGVTRRGEENEQTNDTSGNRNPPAKLRPVCSNIAERGLG